MRLHRSSPNSSIRTCSPTLRSESTTPDGPESSTRWDTPASIHAHPSSAVSTRNRTGPERNPSRKFSISSMVRVRSWALTRWASGFPTSSALSQPKVAAGHLVDARYPELQVGA